MEQKTKLKAMDAGAKFGQMLSQNFFESLMSVDFNNRNEEGKYK